MKISFFASYLNFSEFKDIGKDRKICERERGEGDGREVGGGIYFPPIHSPSSFLS